VDKPENFERYFAAFPKETQIILQQLRETIHKAAPQATEKISYAMPTFFLHGNLVHFAAYQNHIGFYALPSGNEAFRNEISKYRSGKGSVQFPIDEPMPLELIAKIVQFRVQENLLRAESKKSKK
jgi:uncharacterized protein YdhG (YjbR/CyaY superfamily)